MKIGIVSHWFERGIAFISLAMHQALSKEHEVHVLVKPGTPPPLGDEWAVDNLTLGNNQAFGFPLGWAQERELDALIFNERLDCDRLAAIRVSGIKTLCLLEWEFVAPEMAVAINRCYDAIIAPTWPAYRRFNEIGIERVHYVRWGTDLEKFKPPATPRTGPLRFLQPANYGGMHGRKNVRATRTAWGLAKTGEAELVVHSQKREPMTHAQMADLYRSVDVALLPSKWEGLGLTFIEALASGLAIVTVDAPPMNTYVENGFNGYLCSAAMRAPPLGIHIQQAIIDVKDYAGAITALCRDLEKTRQMWKRSRRIAAGEFNWGANGERLVGVVEEVCSE